MTFARHPHRLCVLGDISISQNSHQQLMYAFDQVKHASISVTIQVIINNAGVVKYIYSLYRGPHSPSKMLCVWLLTPIVSTVDQTDCRAWGVGRGGQEEED
jgi:hypothetical protein